MTPIPSCYAMTGWRGWNPGVRPPTSGSARCRNGEPISTAFVESAVNEIIAKRMNKKQQMRWNRARVQPFLDVRTAVLNDTLEDAFRRHYPGFRPANGDLLMHYPQLIFYRRCWPDQA
jgi:hypothetical protein